MPLICPFRAVRYHPARFPDLTPLLTPPYDVISEEEQARYYDRHPKNMIRIDLNRIRPADSETDNRYLRAARHFDDWRRDETFIQDDRPAVYPSSIRYSPPGGGTKILIGVFALVRAEPFETGQILPHELTFASAKQDRLNLLRQCRAHFSPILLLAPDPAGRLRPLLEKAIGASEPAGRAVTDTLTQELWRTTDPALIGELSGLIAQAPLLIADGHHRYETALNYRREIAADPRAREAAGAAAEFCLAFIAAGHDPGLSILPTHRVLGGLPAFDLDRLLDRLKEQFSVVSVPSARAGADPGSHQALGPLLDAMQLHGQTQPTFGLIGLTGSGGSGGAGMPTRAWVLTCNEPAAAQLDVRILQTDILEALLNLQEETAVAAGQLRYVKDAAQAAGLVARREAQLAFLLNPTPIDAIETIARTGGRMPRKTTYFLPKPLTGFVIYPVDSAALPDPLPRA
ncbi:MAG TPA: DUF1015 domain-containing protein [Nitrospiria bacterium]|nr:DUF1015 domain-containing protein [Nitrospiria bacterium]